MLCKKLIAGLVLLVAGPSLACTQDKSLESKLYEYLVAISQVSDSEVKSEVGITDEQIERLGPVLLDLQRQGINLRHAFENDPGRNSKRVEEYIDRIRSTFRDVLIEKQLDRLLQIARQFQLSQNLPSGGMLNPKGPFIPSDKTKARLEKVDEEYVRKIKRLHSEFESRMRELLDERDKDIKSQLSKKQIADYQQYFGKPIARPLELYLFEKTWIRVETSKRIKNELKKNPVKQRPGGSFLEKAKERTRSKNSRIKLKS